MKSRIEVAFTGEVFEAGCKCHEGQFFVGAFFVHPKDGRQPIERKFFATEKDANEGMAAFVNEVAEKVLRANGLIMAEADSVTTSRGEEADRQVQRFMAENGPVSDTVH